MEISRGSIVAFLILLSLYGLTKVVFTMYIYSRVYVQRGNFYIHSISLQPSLTSVHIEVKRNMHIIFRLLGFMAV